MYRRFDNTAYAFGVPERWRTRMEEAGKVELAPPELVSLARTKVVHICFLTIAGPAVVVLCRVLPPKFGFPVGISVTCFSFMVSGVIEGVGNRGQEDEAGISICAHACKTFRAWILGLLCVFFFYGRAADN